MIMILATALAAATPVATWSAPACRPYVAGAGFAEGARVGAALKQGWPEAWRSRGKLADLTLTPEELSRTVATLACIASWPGQEEAAIAAATPLFGSKRHGKTAFAAADALARGSALPAPLRAAVYGFRARMAHAVALKYDRV